MKFIDVEGEGGVAEGGKFSLGVYVSRWSNNLQEQNNLACLKMHKTLV